MKILLKLAGTHLGAILVGWIFEHMSFVIPVKRLRETANLLAFNHPRPSYPFHVIITPKKAIRSFGELAPADPFLADLVTAAQGLVKEFQLTSWRLILNGGSNQNFHHLHFHLVSDEHRMQTNAG